MAVWFRQRRKLWAAIITMMVLIILRKYEITLPGFDQIVTDMIVAALGSLGVHQVRNDP